MRKTKVLKPSKKDLVVINPLTGLKIKEEGQEIVMSTYWARRLKCGDVVEVKSQAKSQEPKESKEETKKSQNNKNKKAEE